MTVNGNGRVSLAEMGVVPLLGESEAEVGRRIDAARRAEREAARRVEDNRARASGEYLERFRRCFDEAA